MHRLQAYATKQEVACTGSTGLQPVFIFFSTLLKGAEPLFFPPFSFARPSLALSFRRVGLTFSGRSRSLEMGAPKVRSSR